MFGKTTEYAIRALVYIYLQNQKGRRPGFREIAANIDSPEQFTAKVLQNLSRAGIISSMKGRGGGFFFDLSDEELTLFNVIKIVEGDYFFSRCGFGLPECSDQDPCPLHTEYTAVRQELYKLVTEQTIQSLAQKISQKKAVLNRYSVLPGNSTH